MPTDNPSTPSGSGEPTPLRIKADADMWGAPTPVVDVAPRLLPPPAPRPLPTEWQAPATADLGNLAPPVLSTQLPPPNQPPNQPLAGMAAHPMVIGEPLLAPAPATRRTAARQRRSLAPPVGLRRRHAAAVARVVAVGVSTTGFVAAVASLATAHPEGEIQAEAPSESPATVVQTRTVHRTVYVDEQGNPIPEFDPSIAEAAIESAVLEAANAPVGSPWAAPGLIDPMEASADEVAVEDFMAAAEGSARTNGAPTQNQSGGSRSGSGGADTGAADERDDEAADGEQDDSQIGDADGAAGDPGDETGDDPTVVDDGSSDPVVDPEAEGEDPAGEDTAGEDPAGEDPAGEDPAGEDPAGEDEGGDEGELATTLPPPPKTTVPKPTTTLRPPTTRVTTTTSEATTTTRPSTTTTRPSTTTTRPSTTTTLADTTTTTRPGTTTTRPSTTTGAPTTTIAVTTTTRPATTTTGAPTTTCTGSKCH